MVVCECVGGWVDVCVCVGGWWMCMCVGGWVWYVCVCVCVDGVGVCLVFHWQHVPLHGNTTFFYIKVH